MTEGTDGALFERVSQISVCGKMPSDETHNFTGGKLIYEQSNVFRRSRTENTSDENGRDR